MIFKIIPFRSHSEILRKKAKHIIYKFQISGKEHQKKQLGFYFYKIGSPQKNGMPILNPW